MHLRRSALPLLGLLVAAMLSACAGARSAAERELATNDVVTHLQNAGVDIQPSGPVSQPFLTETGEEYLVAGGGMLQIYEYQSAAGATLDAQRIEIGAMNATMRPQIYRRENIIAIYIGDTPVVSDALADLLGGPAL